MQDLVQNFNLDAFEKCLQVCCLICLKILHVSVMSSLILQCENILWFAPLNLRCILNSNVIYSGDCIMQA